MIKIAKNLIPLLFLTTVIIYSICILNSCQYEYSSPTPGFLNLKLRAEYLQFDTVFSSNNFALKFTDIKAIRSDGVRVNILQDVKAILPNSITPNIYNIMSRSAYDSSLIVGRYPLPPADYIGLDMIIEPGPDIILDGYRDIPVVQPTPRITSLHISDNFSVVETKTTNIVVTFNLDSVLKKLAYTFLYQPYTQDIMSGSFDAVAGGQYFVPPVNTPASAGGTFNFTRSESRQDVSLSYEITAVEDSADPFTSIHFYEVVSFDEIGRIVYTVSSAPQGKKVFKGTWSNLDALQPLTPALMSDLFSGKLYVSFISAGHPTGLIRGLLKSKTESFVYENFLHYYVTSIQIQ